MSPENRILIEVVDGWALGEECDLPLDRIERLMNAVRAKERARAAEVVRPFAEEAEAFEAFADSHVPQGVSYDVGDLRRAAAYVSDNQSKEG